MPLDQVFQHSNGPEQNLLELYGHLDGPELLRCMLLDVFPGRIAVSSSFGTESAVLLHLIARIAPQTPVIFLNTGMLFAQTEQYQRALEKELGLSDIRIIKPDADSLAEYDPDNSLNKSDPDACCYLRKVLPMQKALEPFDAWITGRKRVHGNDRASLPIIEHDGSHFKINPIAGWSEERIQSTFKDHDLPRHPLEEQGYTSLGCYPCTALPADGQGGRSGRWADMNKTECGIHKAPWAGQGI